MLYEAENPRIEYVLSMPHAIIEEHTLTALSLVAVHGIGAHREETWSAGVDVPGSREKIWRNWLTDETMLRKTFPDIRVLNFGYKSDWFNDPVSHSISSLGNLLWTSLEVQREV